VKSELEVRYILQITFNLWCEVVAVDQVPVVGPIRCERALVGEVAALPVDTDLLRLPPSSSLPQ